MQLVKGRTLAEELHDGMRPTFASVIRISKQSAEALGAAHKAGLIHRDIKPGNVWLEGDRRRVKILDFGLARAGGDANLTGSGFILGTPSYMSPEQAAGRADIFATLADPEASQGRDRGPGGGMSMFKRLFGQEKDAAKPRIRICVECGMPIAEHKEWCAILRGQHRLQRQHHAGDFARRRNGTERAGRLAGVGGEQVFHLVETRGGNLRFVI